MIDIGAFIAAGVVIFFAGRKLSYYGNRIADLTGMGKAWLGLILMAAITSLPELMVGISSSAILESADLAVGDVLGSCAFNLGVLALMDALVPKHKSIFGMVSQSHIMAAGMSIILLSITGVALYLPDEIVVVKGLGLTSAVFIIIYFLSVWILYRFDNKNKQRAIPSPEADMPPAHPNLKVTLLRFTLYALIIVIAATSLPYFADKISEDIGLSQSFAGTLLLAVSTSLPEIAVSIAAVRLGAVDMAVGNLLGSNLFNILILAVDDIFYVNGHLLKDASDVNLISSFSTIVMSAIAITGLGYRLKTKRFWLAWDAVLIFAVYLFNLFVVYRLSGTY